MNEKKLQKMVQIMKFILGIINSLKNKRVPIVGENGRSKGRNKVNLGIGLNLGTPLSLSSLLDFLC